MPSDPQVQVSVVIPMRNGEPYIAQTLHAILEQPGVNLEVIVVNDGSTDGSDQTVTNIQDPRVRMIPGPQQGIAPSLNAGLQAARGQFIVRCDADDLLEPGRLQWQTEFLNHHPQYAAVCGTYRTMTHKGRLLSKLQTGPLPLEITDELQDGQTRTHFGTFMTRAETLQQLGGARPYFNGVEDIDLQTRIASVGRVWYEPVPCYHYRLHESSSTHTQPSPARLFLTDTARAFARQRRDTGTDDLAQGRPPQVPQDQAPGVDVKAQAQGMLIGEAWRYHNAGRRIRALFTGWRACWQRPTSSEGWKSLTALLLKPRRASTGHKDSAAPSPQG